MGLTTGIGMGIQFSRGGSQSWESELVTYMEGLTTPLNTGEKNRLNTFIRSLKMGLDITSLADAFDVICVSLCKNNQTPMRNLVKRANDGYAPNYINFTPLEGMTCNPVGARYIDTNWNGRTEGHAVNYTLNSGSFGIYFNRSTDSETLERHGAYSTVADGGSNNGIIIQKPHGFDKTYALAINCLIKKSDIIDEKISGMYIASRTTSNVQKLWVNKIVKFENAEVTTKIPNQNVNVGALKFTNTASLYWENDQISMYFLGRGFNETEIGVITDAFSIYKASCETLDINNSANFIITLDAGYTNHLTDVYPYLQSKGIKYTGYIQSDTVGLSGKMTWAQIKILQDAGMDMQCHSKTHTDFRTLTEEQIYAELDAVTDSYTSNGLIAPKHHAYPGGYYNSNVLIWVATRRYTAVKINNIIQFTPFGSNVNKTIIDRMGIQNWNIINDGGIIAIKAKIDMAVAGIRGTKCIVTYTHGFDPTDMEQTNADDFDEIISYAIMQGMNIITTSELYDLLDRWI